MPQQKKRFSSLVFNRRRPWLCIANISNMAFQSSLIFIKLKHQEYFNTWLKSRQLYLRGIPFPKRQFCLCLTPFKSTEPRSANFAVPEVMSEGRSGLKVNKQSPPPYLGRTTRSPQISKTYICNNYHTFIQLY